MNNAMENLKKLVESIKNGTSLIRDEDKTEADFTPTMTGNKRSNILYGRSSYDDVIFSYDGNDTVRTQGGNNVVFAGRGNDYVVGGGGADRLYGGEGDDTLYGGGGNDVLVGGDGNDKLHGGDGDDMISGGSGEDKLYGDAGHDILDGGAGNDYLDGGAGNDILIGGAGDDELLGGNGDDILYGGTGNDLLKGGLGSNTYLFYEGDGNDIISDYYGLDRNGTNTLRFENISVDDVQFIGEDYDLVIKYGKNDSVRIQDFFYSKDYNEQANQFVFGGTADTPETVVTTEDLRNNYNINFTYSLGFLGSSTYNQKWDGDTTIYGHDDRNNTISVNQKHSSANANHTLIGGSRNDVLDGGNGNDVLQGGAGNDTLFGHDGDDVLIGGAGNDQLTGGNGNDVYMFGRGDGRDTINNYHTDRHSTDVIQMTDGIKLTDLVIRKTGNSLEIGIKGTNDTITVQNHYSWFSEYRIDGLRLDDGTVLTAEDLENVAEGRMSLSSFSSVRSERSMVSTEHDVNSLVSMMASFGASSATDINKVGSTDTNNPTLLLATSNNNSYGF